MSKLTHLLLATEQFAGDDFNTAIGFELSRAPKQNLQVLEHASPIYAQKPTVFFFCMTFI